MSHAKTKKSKKEKARTHEGDREEMREIVVEPDSEPTTGKTILKQLKKLKKKRLNDFIRIFRTNTTNAMQIKFLVKWVTREMADLMGREFVLMSTLKDTVYFITFGIFATIICLGTTHASSYHLFKVLEQQMLENNGFSSINTASDFWKFLDKAFTKSFYWDYWYYPEFSIKATTENDRNVFYENKLIGVPRLRQVWICYPDNHQVKVRNDTCVIHKYFKRIFLSCYGRFTKGNEDKRPFGDGSETAWVHHTPGELGTSSYWGRIDWYHGGGYYQDLSLHRKETMKIIRTLRKELWITRGTRAVFLDFTVYNANTNLFGVLKSAFEFPPTGGVITSYRAHIVKLLRYTVPFDYFILGCEMIVLGFIVYYLLEELREIFYFRLKYFRFFWSYVDSCIIIMGLVGFSLSLYINLHVHKKLTHIIENPDEFADIDIIAIMQKYYGNISAIMLFFIYLKLFKYLNFNKSMAQLNNTLSKCRKDMMGFAIMFFVIFVAFAVLGYLLFGMEVSDFSTFNLAMFTLLRTILGDFDYTEIEKANRVLAPIFFLCFIFLVFFVLLNMFLAIINDTYTDVKTEIAIAPEELRMSGYLKRGYYNFLIKIGCGRFVKQTVLQRDEFRMTYNEIKVALKKIGFSDLEIEMFYARYNIDENAEVEKYDVQALLDALEGKVDQSAPKQDGQKRQEDSGKPLVEIDDFIKQQERLDEIEKSILKATTAMNDLLNKLDHLENVRKIKVEEKNKKVAENE